MKRTVRVLSTVVVVFGMGAWNGVVGAGASGVPVALQDSMAPCPGDLPLFYNLPSSPSASVVAPGTVLVGVNVGFVQPPGGTVNIVRWFRDGHVAGIGSPSLKVEEADLGSTLVQVASFWTSGDCPPKALGVTQTWKVEAKATVKMSAKEMTVAKGRRATATVKVKADGVKPEGKVKVSWGKNSKTVFMGAADKGRVEVQLPKLAQGRHKVAVDFTDLTGKISESKTERLTLKVK